MIASHAGEHGASEAAWSFHSDRRRGNPSALALGGLTMNLQFGTDWYPIMSFSDYSRQLGARPALIGRSRLPLPKRHDTNGNRYAESSRAVRLKSGTSLGIDALSRGADRW